MHVTQGMRQSATTAGAAAKAAAKAAQVGETGDGADLEDPGGIQGQEATRRLLAMVAEGKALACGVGAGDSGGSGESEAPAVPQQRARMSKAQRKALKRAGPSGAGGAGGRASSTSGVEVIGMGKRAEVVVAKAGAGSFRDEAFYVDMANREEHTEAGLAMSSESTHLSAAVTFDLNGDEGQDLLSKKRMYVCNVYSLQMSRNQKAGMLLGPSRSRLVTIGSEPGICM